MMHPFQATEGVMRGADEASGSLFSYVDLGERVPAGHPLRKIRQIVNEALSSLAAGFDALWTGKGRLRPGPADHAHPGQPDDSVEDPCAGITGSSGEVGA